MGTQGGERDWVAVANELFDKCHISLKLRNLTDCDANICLALYENILGEKVPDYIAVPNSQEDDIHNVQSVIDSLSLDYLQISLSHITGENVVRGDKEAIKNLLEIFDGLLEYLNEEIREESQDGEEPRKCVDRGDPDEIEESTNCDPTQPKETEMEGASLSSNGESRAQSSKHSLHSWNAEEIGSTSELFGLGVSARTFAGKQEGPTVPPHASGALPAAGPLDAQDAPLSGPLHSATALQPPSQGDTPHRPVPESHGRTQAPQAAGPLEGQTGAETRPLTTEMPGAVSDGCRSPAVSEKSSSSQQRTGSDVDREPLEPTNGGPRRVLFRTQPDVLFLTLQDEMAPSTLSPPDTDDEDEEEEEEEEEGEDLGYSRRLQGDRILDRERTSNGSGSEEPLSDRRLRNRKAEEELHHISEKLSHRIVELDEMLKRVLGESEESSEVGEEDRQSRRSGGVPEFPGSPGQRIGRSTIEPTHHRTPSLSPSPPRVHGSQQAQGGNAAAEALSLDDGRQTNCRASEHSRREELRQIKLRKYLEEKAHVLQRYENTGRTDLNKARIKAQEAEREYREAILGDVSQDPGLSPGGMNQRSQRNAHKSAGRRRQETPRKAPSLKVKENDLLPLLQEELPHLHISPHALGRMWEQQMQQVDGLRAASSSRSQRRRGRLAGQVEEAQRKYDLLLEIVRKDQEHKGRLRDFKERIQQQKSTQNRLKEQRQQVARAKRYYDDYHVQHRARLMKARTKEERMFRRVFEDGLEVQRVRLREQSAYAREQQVDHQRRQQDHIASMENYYKDQFSLLAEKLAQERQDIQVRKKAQEKALLKMKRELRARMEREIGELQQIVVGNNEDDHFQELEVQRLRGRVHMASFEYNTSYLH